MNILIFLFILINRLPVLVSPLAMGRSCKNSKPLQKSSKIILGVDPGTLAMGYAIIEIVDSNVKMREMKVLRLSAQKDNHERLQLIYEKISEIIKKYHPQEFAIEAPFFGKNVQSMLKLGRAQGVAIAAAISAGLSVTEYSPKKIKQSITGNGNADKEQVWKMLQQILSIKEKPPSFDATDALAVALCHYFQTTSLLHSAAKGFSGWDDFIKQNPNRIK